MVLYFSGTGNSRYVAQMIANITGDYTVDLGSYLRDKEQLIVHSDVPCLCYAHSRLADSQAYKRTHRKSRA